MNHRDWVIDFPDFDLTYVRVPKAATNSILTALAKGFGIEPDKITRHPTKKKEVGNIIRGPFPTKHFLIASARNPYSKVLSFFCNKIKETSYEETRQIVKSYGITRKEDKEMTFREFVFRLDLVPYHNFEPHLWRQWGGFFLEKMDRIFKIEKLDKEFPKFIKEKYDKEITMPHELTTSHNKWKDYYNKEMKEIVYNIYEEDFEKLGYSK